MAMEPPLRELRRLLERGIENREFRKDLDVELSLSLLLGPIIYWHVFLKKSEQSPRELAEGVVDAFWRAFGEPDEKRKVTKSNSTSPRGAGTSRPRTTGTERTTPRSQ
jgi:hypothetical protein